MREIVSRQFQRVRLIPCRHQGQVSICFQRAVQIAQFAVDLCRQRSLGEPWANRSGNIRRGSAGRDFAHATIGKADLEHLRSEEHTSELQSLMRISYAVFCLKKKKI